MTSRRILISAMIVGVMLAMFAVGASAGQDAGVSGGPVPDWVADTAEPVADVAAVDAPAVAPDVEADPVGSVERLLAHVRAGEWRMVAAFLIAFLMYGFSRFKIRDRVKWFRGDRGGAVLVMLLALGAALSASLASQAPLDWRLFLGAVGVCWTAVGGFTWAKRLIWPKDGAPAEEPTP